jgi:hypothetical protein
MARGTGHGNRARLDGARGLLRRHVLVGAADERHLVATERTTLVGATRVRHGGRARRIRRWMGCPRRDRPRDGGAVGRCVRLSRRRQSRDPGPRGRAVRVRRRPRRRAPADCLCRRGRRRRRRHHRDVAFVPRGAVARRWRSDVEALAGGHRVRRGRRRRGGAGRAPTPRRRRRSDLRNQRGAWWRRHPGDQSRWSTSDRD